MMSQVSKTKTDGCPAGTQRLLRCTCNNVLCKGQRSKANLKTDEDVYPKPPAGWIFCPFVD